MVAEPVKGYSDEIAWEFFDDIPSLSSIAAMELSNLICDRTFETEALNRLEKKIYESILEESSLDRTTVVIMNMAIEDAKLYDKAVTVEALVANAREIRNRLLKIISNPQEVKNKKPEELPKMRDFCRKLYKWSSALEPSIYEMEPWHPFRR